MNNSILTRTRSLLLRHAKGHVWEKDEDGEIDIFAFSVGWHNGPRCIKCDYTFCHHCFDMIPEYTCEEYQEVS